jgi:hypothetical protein
VFFGFLVIWVIGPDGPDNVDVGLQAVNIYGLVGVESHQPSSLYGFDKGVLDATIFGRQSNNAIVPQLGASMTVVACNP